MVDAMGLDITVTVERSVQHLQPLAKTMLRNKINLSTPVSRISGEAEKCYVSHPSNWFTNPNYPYDDPKSQSNE